MDVCLMNETVLVPGRETKLLVSVPRRGLVVSCLEAVDLWPRIVDAGAVMLHVLPRESGTLPAGTVLGQVMPPSKFRKGGSVS